MRCFSCRLMFLLLYYFAFFRHLYRSVFRDFCIFLGILSSHASDCYSVIWYYWLTNPLLEFFPVQSSPLRRFVYRAMSFVVIRGRATPEKSRPPGLISRRHAHLGYEMVYMSSVLGLRVGCVFTVAYHHRVRPLAGACLHDRQVPFGASSRAIEGPLAGGSNDVKPS